MEEKSKTPSALPLSPTLLGDGKGFSKRYLAYFRKFYLTIPNYEILQTRLQNVLWSHILTALRVDDPTAIRWYLETASREMWSVRMYDELKRTEGDNPTIGIVLCSETSKDIARYSILKGNEQLFAAKYKTFLPSEEQLRTEIERQKQLFMLQHELTNKEDK